MTRRFKDIVFSVTDSALAALVAGMSANSWSSFSITGLTSSISFPDGETSPITAFFSKFVWDAAHKRMVASCESHGLYFARTIMWDDATNTIDTTTYPSPIPDGSGANPSHGYYMNAMNKATGDHYWHLYNSHAIRKRVPWNGSWADATADDLGANDFACAFDWFPDLNSGAGGLVTANESGVTRSNAAVTSWTTSGLGHGFGGSLVLGGGANAQVYNPVDNCSYTIGGGASAADGAAASTSVVRMLADGTVTQRTDVPIAVGTTAQSGGEKGLALSGLSAVGSLPARQPIIVGTGTSAPVYRQTDADTWSQVTTRPFTVQNGDWCFAGCAIETYGCYLFIYGQSPPLAYVWKP